MTRIIGLTGNIACGKSTVAKILKAQGITVIDADEVSRLVDYTEVEKVFGTRDRQKLREIVFASPEKRKELEAIVHPLIRVKSEELLKSAIAGAAPESFVVYEAPLLVETGVPEFIKGLLVITCPEAKQLERILARDPSMTRELALKIKAAQIPQSQKVAAAHWVISNDGDEAHLEKKVLDWVNLVKNS